MTARFSGSDFKVMLFKFLTDSELSCCLFWQKSLSESCGGRGGRSMLHREPGFLKWPCLPVEQVTVRCSVVGWFGCWLCQSYSLLPGMAGSWNKVGWLWPGCARIENRENWVPVNLCKMHKQQCVSWVWFRIKQWPKVKKADNGCRVCFKITIRNQMWK